MEWGESNQEDWDFLKDELINFKKMKKNEEWVLTIKFGKMEAIAKFDKYNFKK